MRKVGTLDGARRCRLIVFVGAGSGEILRALQRLPVGLRSPFRSALAGR